MPTKGSITKTARITGEDWNIIEGQITSSFSNWVHERVNGGGAYVDVPSSITSDLALISRERGLSLSDLIRVLDDGLNDGYIEIEDGKVVGHIDTRSFERICSELKVDSQITLDKMVDIMRRKK